MNCTLAVIDVCLPSGVFRLRVVSLERLVVIDFGLPLVLSSVLWFVNVNLDFFHSKFKLIS